MNWKTVRLELAATSEFPSGSVSRGYLVRLPLNEDGSIDDTGLAGSPSRATVRRFWSSEPDENGRVENLNGALTLRCAGHRLLSIRPQIFKHGQEVTIAGPDGMALPFRVASIHEIARQDQRL